MNFDDELDSRSNAELNRLFALIYLEREDKVTPHLPPWPNVSVKADEVMPYLDKVRHASHRDPHCYIVTIYTTGSFYQGQSETYARAATIALIRWKRSQKTEKILEKSS